MFVYMIVCDVLSVEPEELSTKSSPKRELTQHDICTLKQQLQEIKEQVSFHFEFVLLLPFRKNLFALTFILLI